MRCPGSPAWPSVRGSMRKPNRLSGGFLALCMLRWGYGLIFWWWHGLSAIISSITLLGANRRLQLRLCVYSRTSGYLNIFPCFMSWMLYSCLLDTCISSTHWPSVACGHMIHSIHVTTAVVFTPGFPGIDCARYYGMRLWFLESRPRVALLSQSSTARINRKSKHDSRGRANVIICLQEFIHRYKTQTVK